MLSLKKYSILKTLIFLLISTNLLFAQQKKGLKKEGLFSEQVNGLIETTPLRTEINRVDGFFVAYQFPKDYLLQWNWAKKTFNLKPEHKFDIHFYVGYAFNAIEDTKKKKWRFSGEISKGFFETIPVYVGARYYRMTDSKDNWRVGLSENSASTAILSRDYRDYFKRIGQSLFLKFGFDANTVFEVEYKFDKHRSLETTNTRISLFREDKLRYNPSLGPESVISNEILRPSDAAQAHGGKYNSLRLAYTWKTWERKNKIRLGYELNAEIEKTMGKESTNDFGFYLLEGKAYLPVTKKISYNTRVRLGSLTETDLQQKRFEIGGISTLRGSDFKQYRGNRMFLWNNDLFFHSWTDSKTTEMIGWLGQLNFILMLDIGQVWSEDESDNFYKAGGFSFSDLEADVGVALTEKTGDLRLELNRTLSQKENQWAFYVRYSWDF
ncbi:MAG: hypothetical protein DWQ06_07075 [Calditrichaeota bacterium]|nr:MAG: hypothetical protein DWQ06_07075 [Calditrichota bacterium]